MSEIKDGSIVQLHTPFRDLTKSEHETRRAGLATLGDYKLKDPPAKLMSTIGDKAVLRIPAYSEQQEAVWICVTWILDGIMLADSDHVRDFRLHELESRVREIEDAIFGMSNK